MTPIRVLVIDDDAELRDGLVLLLEGQRFVVSSACDGADGLRCAKVHLPHVITLDLQMPVVDGWAFRVQQREDAALVDIPVIVVTGWCGARGDLDAAAFFAKPCDFKELVAAIATHGRRYLDEHRAQA